MKTHTASPTAAVIGAGISGAACAAGLRHAGVEVTVFEKSGNVGGRMATRRASWVDEAGVDQTLQFDHGAQMFSARHPRFRSVMAGAQQVGCVAAFEPRFHGALAACAQGPQLVAVPTMPALCRHLLRDADVLLSHRVQRLERRGSQWQVVGEDGSSNGPFDHVLIALPPSQAALLLAGHQDEWADTLSTTPMHPVWTLMAMTDDCEWPWDVAIPDRGALAWVGRNDRKPQRHAPLGKATWVARATSEWSLAHIDDDPQRVCKLLSAELKKQLPRTPAPSLHHAAVHRWRYALPAVPAPAVDAWWDATLSLGVCGDFLGDFQGGSDVEGAWRSGDELADTVAAGMDIMFAAEVETV